MNEPIISKGSKLDRREFLKATGGFLLAVTLQAETSRALAQGSRPATSRRYIRIGADESITVLVGGGEMGQGIYTGLSMAAAEEMMVKWEKVKVEPLSGWHLVALGGQRRHPFATPNFLKAGAAAREMLVSAAAQTWGVATTDARRSTAP